MKTKRNDVYGFGLTRSGFLRKRAGILMLALAALSLAACATTAPREDPVVERAKARWEAVLSGDLEKAYGYYSPGFRSANSLIDYGVSMRTRRVQWTGATYREHECDGDRCKVTFDIKYIVRNPVPGLKEYNGISESHEVWIRTGGEWWYVPNK
jgi:hypothetical protein